MRFRSRVAVFVFLASTLFSETQAGEFRQVDAILGTPAPSAAKAWLRFSVLGDRNAPYPIVWISPYSFRRVFPESLVQLTSKEFEALVLFTRTFHCSHVVSKYPASGTIAISQFQRSSAESVCVLPKLVACRYLSEVFVLQDIRWTKTKREPMDALYTSLRCGDK